MLELETVELVELVEPLLVLLVELDLTVKQVDKISNKIITLF
jgi:hypothetical protein